VPAGWERQVLVGQLSGPAPEDDADGQVLVDHDHGWLGWSAGDVVVVATAAQEGVGGAQGVEGGLELTDEISVDEPGKDGTAFWGDARVTGATPTPAFLQQLLTDAHPDHSALPSYRSVRHLAPHFTFSC
jgi:hypothetical protein